MCVRGARGVTWVSATALGFRWQNLVDFVVLSLFIYLLLRWSGDARALRVTLGILIVLFQPELRHALNTLEVALKRSDRRGARSHALEVVSAAAFSLAGAGRGALLVLTRRDSIKELLPGGVPLGGHVSPVGLAERSDAVIVVNCRPEIDARRRAVAGFDSSATKV